jgi:hypothetical protein
MTSVGRSRLLVILLAAASSACDSSGVTGPGDLGALTAAEERWMSRTFADYRYETRTGCFCPPEVSQWVRVTVQDGAVVSAEPVDPDAEYPITTLLWWHPIDSLFARLRRTITDPASAEIWAEVSAQYHEELGYPIHITYRTHPNIADGDSNHELRNLEPLPPP